MATTVTDDVLRELASFRSASGCAISVYLDLDPSTAPTAREADAHFNSVLSEAEKAEAANRGSLTHDQKRGLQADFERMRRWFDEEFSRDGARGLAVFAASLDGYWRVLPLPEPVSDAVTIDRTFRVAPLAPLLRRGAGVLVAAVGRERGDIYRLRLGELEAVADHSEDAPRRHDQGGWSQARFQRHVDTLAAEHMATVADELDRRVRARGVDAIVVACTEEKRSQFAELLSQEAQAALAGWVSAEAHASPPELLEAARPVLDEWSAGRERQALERWREEAGKDGRATAGWHSTLEAASDGRVETLLFGNGPPRPGFVCPKCGRASAEPGSCPLDGTPLEERENALDLAVHRTLAHGGSLLAVLHHDDLGPVEGIGALLRF
jgi:peptide chain release factor subunit 1